MTSGDLRKQFEKEYGWTALYRDGGFAFDYVCWLEDRLAEEIDCGHKYCTADNCKSSGTDCPAGGKETDDPD